MSKAVLISIQPKWCEKIANGEKTIEVRKSKPKLEPPFKCYIYCTKGRGDCLWGWCGDICYDTQFPNERPNRLDGKVIGEFVCDRIAGEGETIRGNACLTVEELQDYCNGKDIYFWHITDLTIYDKPKDLSEFGQKCDMAYEIRCRDCLIRKGWNECCEVMCKPITRPPQSWCYVEEL